MIGSVNRAALFRSGGGDGKLTIIEEKKRTDSISNGGGVIWPTRTAYAPFVIAALVHLLPLARSLVK
jgi:hypothetical protein